MMAAPTVFSSSSSSSSASRWTYDVFLNFKGEDTRNNLTSDLNAALVSKGIRTFMDSDSENLEIGEQIPEGLENVIKESMFAIIIFSENYANSKWCLEELALIMETHGQKVFPVFLEKLDPSKVEGWRSGKYFEQHETRFGREVVERLGSALIQAAQASGFRLKDFGNQKRVD
ncbi:TMV resistance protein N-like [Macadamia integrifolia]|uniref:TMV resistance protein N-like n=1 Tax=Macadamia integrifolia TaxID=60698 RepID=UPI001C4E9ED0|nr:TMV resistance protein N-like [Macadamia integrifolia]